MRLCTPSSVLNKLEAAAPGPQTETVLSLSAHLHSVPCSVFSCFLFLFSGAWF